MIYLHQYTNQEIHQYKHKITVLLQSISNPDELLLRLEDDVKEITYRLNMSSRLTMHQKI